MKLSIKTDKLQDMVSRSIKGSSNNKLIPLTGLMAIELKDNRLTLITTDATNYLYIREDKVEGDDFYVTVPVEMFSKLVARMTCETITLELKDNALDVKGNGTYSIELPLDEDGGLIKYPDPVASFLFKKETKDINFSTVGVILNSLKPALAVTLENPCYTGYYVGERVVATDTYKIASMSTTLFERPKLISPEMMNLLAVMSVEKIHVDMIDDIIVFSSPDCVVYGTAMEGLEEYAIDAITNLIDTEFGSSCKLSKTSLLHILDRLSLFVTTFDKNGIYLTFTNEGIQFSSKSSSGVETVLYMESSNPKEFTCCVDIEMLLTQIKAQATDVIELYYGLDNALKMVDGNIVHIVALLEDDRVTE